MWSLKFIRGQLKGFREVTGSNFWIQESAPLRNYAKATGGGASVPSLGKKGKISKAGGPTTEKKKFPVETDPQKLVSYCCGTNIEKEGEPVKLKENHEYPDWLWKLNTGDPVPIDQLDPETDEYWNRVQEAVRVRGQRLAGLTHLSDRK